MISKAVLKEYRYIKKESEDIGRRIEKINKQLQELESSGTVLDSVSGGSGGKQHFRIEGFPTRDYTKKKNYLLMQRHRHEINLSRLKEIEGEVCEFIDGIKDSRARIIYRMYYEDGKSQQQIALKMNLDQGTVSKELRKYIL